MCLLSKAAVNMCPCQCRLGLSCAHIHSLTVHVDVLKKMGLSGYNGQLYLLWFLKELRVDIMRLHEMKWPGSDYINSGATPATSQGVSVCLS